MRTMILAATFLTLAVPVAGQHDHGAGAAGEHKLPAGWHGRTDNPNDALSGVMLMPMGSGVHVKTGPRGILWNAAHVASGNFTASATFAANAQPVTEAYGLVIGGKDLEKPNLDYAYFIIRGDGSYMIRHRAGSELHTIQPWTKHAAVKTGASMTNTLAVTANAQKIRYLINGTEVASYDRNAPMNADGIVGLRINHRLELMITDFTITKQ